MNKKKKTLKSTLRQIDKELCTVISSLKINNVKFFFKLRILVFFLKSNYINDAITNFIFDFCPFYNVTDV